MSFNPKFKSSISNCKWLAVPYQIANDVAAQILQLEYSQWLPAEVLISNQLKQLEQLLRYAKDQSPFYGNRLKLEETISLDNFQKIPLLTRRDLAEHFNDINCKIIPKDHHPIQMLQTSGSTGQIVMVKRTAFNNLIWAALTMRDHFWHQRDFSQSSATVKAHINAQDDEQIAHKEGWGPPAALLFDTGPAYQQSLSLSVGEQAEWLLRRNPYYLLTYPTNLNALLNEFEKLQQFPNHLKEIRSIGETLSADLSERCRKLGLKTVDIYSAQEVGIIALQCPVSGLYHIQSESLIVEILDEENNQCSEGQIGKIVVTDLHNFATPIIRYEIRDYAKVGGKCSCGRGLPTLVEILGRRRNMITLPDGSIHWPSVGLHKFREIAPIEQYQLIQHSLQLVEIRLVIKGGLTSNQEAQFTNVIQTALGYPFPLKFVFFEEELPRTRGGKFEEFISLL
jgi:phenylacetate-CoA ligase